MPTMTSTALRTLLAQCFVAAQNSQCPATWVSLGGIARTFSCEANMVRVFSDPAEFAFFDARDWLGTDCGYFYPERMNSDFKRVTGKTRDEWLTNVGWS